MVRHKKIYCEYFGFEKGEFIPCEVCGAEAVDLHHIQRRGMGGSDYADHILNIMAVCRPCHIDYGDKKQHKLMLRETHLKMMMKLKPVETEALLNQIYSA